MMIPREKFSITWTYEDVIEKAKMRGIKLSKAKACEVLGLMEKYFDAEIGISWMTVDYWIDEVTRRPKKCSK